ncbi:MAG: histidine kinase [Anaerolineae bacterium]|nr:histidine kinase [Anaerolineae bacterium]
MSDPEAKLEALSRELSELKASMPAHSVPPSLLMRIEELEDEMAELRSIVDEQQMQESIE